MADAISVSGAVAGDPDKIMSLETGKLAGLAGGAVMAGLGNTRILVTATAAKGVREGIDFFPLTVDIEERTYAAGKIPGSFFRREGRAADSAILTCRLIDRPLRPSFPEGFRNEVHIVGTVVGADQHNPHDVLAINAASAALTISDVPFSGPIGAVRIAYTTDGEWIAHPTFEEGDESTFEMVVAGRELDDGDVAVMMVEAGGTEKSWSVLRGRRPQGRRGRAGRVASRTPSSGSRRPSPCRTSWSTAIGGKKPTMEFPDADRLHRRAVRRGRRRWPSAKLGDIQKIADKAERTAAEGALRDEVLATAARPVRRRRRDAGHQAAQGGLQVADQVDRAHPHRRRGPPHRRSWPPRHPSAVGRGRRAADRARLGPLPAWRDPGPQRHHHGHGQDGPDDRRHHADDVQALHAPLQLPAVLDR